MSIFDPEFDPFEIMEKLKEEVALLRHNQLQMASALNNVLETQNKVIAQLNDNTKSIQELHNRIQLMEIARQYENKTN